MTAENIANFTAGLRNIIASQIEFVRVLTLIRRHRDVFLHVQDKPKVELLHKLGYIKIILSLPCIHFDVSGEYRIEAQLTTNGYDFLRKNKDIARVLESFCDERSLRFGEGNINAAVKLTMIALDKGKIQRT